MRCRAEAREVGEGSRLCAEATFGGQQREPAPLTLAHSRSATHLCFLGFRGGGRGGRQAVF